MTERLTTLTAVRDWLNITTDTSDPMLVRVIDAVSQYVLNYLNRTSFQRATYTQNFRGYGKPSVMLQSWPVLSVTSVDSDGVSFLASTFLNGVPGTGYYVSDPRDAPQFLHLRGGSFTQGGFGMVVYEAGFEASEDTEIPADPFQITASLFGVWSSNLGVVIDGAPATLVTSTPTTGQYKVDDWGTYTFALADVGKDVTLNYSYTPHAVSLAATEIVGEWFKRKDRIGLMSKSLGGQETVTFSQADMTKSSRSMLQAFANVVPS